MQLAKVYESSHLQTDGSGRDAGDRVHLCMFITNVPLIVDVKMFEIIPWLAMLVSHQLRTSTAQSKVSKSDTIRIKFSFDRPLGAAYVERVKP